MVLKNAFKFPALSTSGTTAPIWRVTCANAEAPRRFLPNPKSTATNTLFPLSTRNCGVIEKRTSFTGENAETINETGEITSLSFSPSFQVVFIERESLPTGMLIPKSGHKSKPIALTVSYSAASCPGCPQAAIQFADNLISEILAIGAAAIFVNASPIAIRPDAGALITAIGVLSPIAIASPAYPSKLIKVTAQSATGTCHGPTI